MSEPSPFNATALDATSLDAGALRAAFDQAFASAAATSDAEGDTFLLLRVAGDPYALRVLDLAEITRYPRVVPLPSADPAFIGLTSLRGAMVPVFALGVMLGYPPAAAPGAWLARCAHSQGMIAFAFDATDGFTRGVATAAGGALREGGGGDGGARRDVVVVGGAVRPLVRVADLFADIDRRVSARRKGS
ncbi:MAG: chemotaxis protein CheW [Myxococcota bacterium]